MYYIGVDVGGTNLVAGLMNEDCEILDKASHLVDHSQRSGRWVSACPAR